MSFIHILAADVPQRERILTEWWADVWMIIGLLLGVATIAGLIYGIRSFRLAKRQMEQTATAADAAAEAARDAIEETRNRYDQFVLNQALVRLTECEVAYQSESWDRLAIRAGDLADVLMQLSQPDERWTKHATNARRFQQRFATAAKSRTNEPKFSEHMRGRWNRLTRELRSELTARLGLFAPNSGRTER